MTQDESIPYTPRRRIRSFVIRAGRMTAGQERAWQELWPRFGIDYTPDPLDLDRHFGRTAPHILEIGFGTGDALLAYAQQHPEHDCIGIEVHPPGVGHLLLKIQEAGLTNVRVICHDAVEVLSHCLSNSCLAEVHIFFPDPWHKKRHHKRRLIQTPFIELLARVVRPGGIIKLGTDWQNYAEQMLQLVDAHPDFDNLAYVDRQNLSPQPSPSRGEGAEDATNPSVVLPITHHASHITLARPDMPSGFVARPEHRPLTRFERRGHRLGHGVWDLAYKRR
jgi:tRNA (guanine-N7-)-methyltransferase